ncbi:hypothetical protein JRQ81_010260, partial [Phrynocephalus forsythii]
MGHLVICSFQPPTSPAATCAALGVVILKKASAAPQVRGSNRTMVCSNVQYWDELLQSCKSCLLVCHPLKVKACADFCRSVDCRRRPGFYYDSLLRDCIDCSSVCGQHPTECQPFCLGAKPWPPSDITSAGKQ